MRQYFDQIDGSSNANSVQQLLHLRLRDGARNIAAGLRGEDRYSAPNGVHDRSSRQGRIARAPTCSSARAWTLRCRSHAGARRALREDRRRRRARWCRHRPASAGSRTTSCTSSFRRELPTTTTLEGDYDYVLPSFDCRHRAALDDLKFRASCGQDHRPPGLGRHPGRPGARPAGTRRRRHRFAGQSGPEAAGVEQLSTCRSSGTTPKAATRRSATSTRTSTTTSASRQIVATPFGLRTPVRRRATGTKPWPAAAPTRTPPASATTSSTISGQPA